MATAARFAIPSTILLFAASVAAQTVTVTATITAASATPTITAVSDCHAHGTVK
jgi:zinc transporter 1/2/3